MRRMPAQDSVYIIVHRANNGHYAQLWRVGVGWQGQTTLHATPEAAEAAGRTLATDHGSAILGVRHTPSRRTNGDQED